MYMYTCAHVLTITQTRTVTNSGHLSGKAGRWDKVEKFRTVPPKVGRLTPMQIFVYVLSNSVLYTLLQAGLTHVTIELNQMD